MNPYDLPAQPFLALYILLFCLSLGFGIHERCRRRKPAPTADPAGLTPVDLAFLARGPERAMDTAIVGLLQAGAAAFDPWMSRLRATGTGQVPNFLTRFHDCLRTEAKVTALVATFRPVLEEVRAGLAKRGLVYPVEESKRIGWQSATPLFLLTFFGAVRVVLGHSRGHPVGYILLLTLQSALAGHLLLAFKPVRLPAGSKALRSYRASSQRLMRAPMDAELMLATALTGVSILKGSPFSEYVRIRLQSTGGGSDASGCSGSGCGGAGDVAAAAATERAPASAACSLRKFEEAVGVAPRALFFRDRRLGAGDFGAKFGDIIPQIGHAERIQRNRLQPALFCRPNFFVV